ncbi:MAG: 50S ribosomal protein L6 [Candidatus Eutrophobiaceae bacterium]
MARIANNPVKIPKEVELRIDGATVTAKGRHGELSHTVAAQIKVERDGDVLRTRPLDGLKRTGAIAGTTRMALQNIVIGVSEGFEKRLEIIGVGYRAQMKGKDLSLLLGFSHPVTVSAPAGTKIETPSQTEILIWGMDKQKVGQLAAEIRSWRPPEPYKGKGIRYKDEYVVRKEAKKS